MDSSTKSFRLCFILCFVAMVSMLTVQLLTHLFHELPIPSRLFWFCIAACCYCMLFSIWQISRRKRKALQADAPRPAAPENTLRNSAKVLGLFALELAFVCAVVAVIFHTPFRRILSDYFLFLAPFLVGMPLILHARKFRDRPKRSAAYTASGLAILVILLELAMLYSGLMKWLVPAMTSSDALIFAIIFLAVAAFVFISAYTLMHSRRASQQP